MTWYKKAQHEIIKGPDIDVFDPTVLEEFKLKLETKYPRVNWTLEKVQNWINDTFIGKMKPWDKPKDLLQRPL